MARLSCTPRSMGCWKAIGGIGQLLQPGALCATLIQLDPMKLVGFANELQIARLTDRRACRCPACRWARSGRRGHIPCPVRRSASTRTFRVEITVAEPR